MPSAPAPRSRRPASSSAIVRSLIIVSRGAEREGRADEHHARRDRGGAPSRLQMDGRDLRLRRKIVLLGPPAEDEHRASLPDAGLPPVVQHDVAQAARAQLLDAPGRAIANIPDLAELD